MKLFSLCISKRYLLPFNTVDCAQQILFLSEKSQTVNNEKRAACHSISEMLKCKNLHLKAAFLFD